MVKKGIKELVAEADAEIQAVSAAEAIELSKSEDTVIVDIRDIRELHKLGRIAGATHAPRGMLEFWVDPDSPYHREVFSSGKKLVLYCAMGWRSALATKTLQDMGLDNVCHIDGGFGAWTEAGGPTEDVEKK